MTTSHITCPVCLDQPMHKVRLGPEAKLELDLCERCGGVWFDQGEVQGLRSLATVEDIQSEIPRRTSKMRCHGCSARILRDERVCFECGRENILSCPCCQEPMLVERHAGLLLDVCRSCKGVWFDNAELEAIWSSDFVCRSRSYPLRHRRGHLRQPLMASGTQAPIYSPLCRW